jgi:tRNA threonylcarbamoyladenosine biosynthesis protein TsaB
MLMLALECSTERASVALFEGEQLLAQRFLEVGRRHEQVLWDVLEALMHEAGRTVAGVGLYIVGRGPGRYTGLRMALAAAELLALPGNRRVMAVSSGQALAHALARERPGAQRVAVVGDARRGHYWMALFTPVPGGVRQDGDWALYTMEALAAALPPGVVAVSSEWDRLAPHLPSDVRAGADWVVENRYPDARSLGEIALRRQKTGDGMEPLSLLYMHPPVDQSLASRQAEQG